MLLIHTPKITPRLDYSFKHICARILGLKVSFTSVIEEFIAHDGPKMSYGKQPMGDELFVHANGLLQEQGFEDLDINVTPWEDTHCFFSVSGRSSLPFDIFSATFYLLSRYEEYLPHVKDDFGRYPATESLCFKAGLLEQPVVDIWAYKFKAILLERFPNLSFPKKTTEVHHLLDASRPFEFSQRGFLRSILGFGADLSKFRVKRLFDRSRVLLKLRKDPYDVFTWLINNAKSSTSKLSVFFLLGKGFSFREDLNTKRKKFVSLVKFVADYTEVGLIFSFHSLKSYEELKIEKKQIEELTHRTLESAFNDYFIVDLPNSYRNLVELEVKKDFTMVYNENMGFRAGTCTPFLFYDLDYEIKTPLVVQPIAGKASTFMGMKSSEIEAVLKNLYNNIDAVNGTFSMIFSNKDFVNNKKNRAIRTFFSEN